MFPHNLVGEHMKKIIIILFCITVCYSIFSQKEEILIPEDSIRFRVIANSDSEEDQSIKLQIKEQVEQELNRFMIQAKNKEEAKKLIENNLPNIENILNSYQIPYQMNLGMNEFPEKEYKGITYEEGVYESLVITLGKGIGKNWWCVMFPPLCLLEAEENNLDEVEYKFYVKEMLNKYLE